MQHSEAATIEGRLADIIEADDAVIRINEYRLSGSDRAVVVAALRLAAAVKVKMEPDNKAGRI